MAGSMLEAFHGHAVQSQVGMLRAGMTPAVLQGSTGACATDTGLRRCTSATCTGIFRRCRPQHDESIAGQALDCETLIICESQDCTLNRRPQGGFPASTAVKANQINIRFARQLYARVASFCRVLTLTTLGTPGGGVCNTLYMSRLSSRSRWRCSAAVQACVDSDRSFEPPRMRMIHRWYV